MKKWFLIILAMVFLFAIAIPVIASNEANWTFKIKVKVVPWIKVNPCLSSVVMWMPPLGQEKENVSADLGWYESFYSNVPFRKTYSGTNPAGDGYPIFARQERLPDGSGVGRYDRLYTKLTFETVVNGLGADPYREDLSVVFEAPGGNNNTGSWWWGRDSLCFRTPHDGEVWEKTFATAGRKMPDFSTDNVWYESADAGIYELTVYETLVGLNTPQSSDAY